MNSIIDNRLKRDVYEQMISDFITFGRGQCNR